MPTSDQRAGVAMICRSRSRSSMSRPTSTRNPPMKAEDLHQGAAVVQTVGRLVEVAA